MQLYQEGAHDSEKTSCICKVKTRIIGKPDPTALPFVAPGYAIAARPPAY